MGGAQSSDGRRKQLKDASAQFMDGGNFDATVQHLDGGSSGLNGVQVQQRKHMYR